MTLTEFYAAVLHDQQLLMLLLLERAAWSAVVLGTGLVIVRAIREHRKGQAARHG